MQDTIAKIPLHEKQTGNMLRIFLLLCFALHIGINYGQIVKSNVELTIRVSPFINTTEQMLYVYQLNGNIYSIDDSIRIEPGCDKYVVHANVPYETTIRLLFSKRGPLHMQVLARPKDKITLEITEEDQKVGISNKRLLKGTPHHDAFVDFWKTIYSIGDKRRKAEKALTVYSLPAEDKKQLQAIVDSCNKTETDFERSIITSSLSPYVICTALNLINKNIPSEEYINLVKTAYHRFPTYYPLQMEHSGGKWPSADENSAKVRQFIRSVERTRIMQSQINVAKGDTLAIGQKLDLTLIDSIGNKHHLTSFAGKYVLLELWASWCLPCIQAMPNIIYAQKVFADDFVCCAITIDKDVYAWKRAIKREGLQTLNHFKGTDEKGEIFTELKRLIAKGTIPQNYLLDREGRIIAINIYGEELIKKLEELTKK